MRSVFLGVPILFCISLAAFAQSFGPWMRYEANVVAESFVRVDQSSKDLRRYQALVNYRTPAGSALSAVAEYEMRCFDKEWRFLGSTSYGGHFGAGEIVGALSSEQLAKVTRVRADAFSRIDGAGIQHYRLVCSR